jgi:Arc/MetJ-type ribon-helix-helix transcriptional regulator
MAIDKSKRGTAISANVPFALAQAVYAHVKDGSHASAGAVVRAALRQYLRLDDDDQPLPPEETAPG